MELEAGQVVRDRLAAQPDRHLEEVRERVALAAGLIRVDVRLRQRNVGAAPVEGVVDNAGLARAGADRLVARECGVAVACLVVRLCCVLERRSEGRAATGRAG